MTTNEQAEYTPSEADRGGLSELLMAMYDHGTQPNALREADIFLASPWLAAEHHRVAAYVTRYDEPLFLAADRYQDGAIGWTELAEAVERWRHADRSAAFPAVGGSTPAVDGSEPDEWCREEGCRYRHWRSGDMPTHKRGAHCPTPAVDGEGAAENLPSWVQTYDDKRDWLAQQAPVPDSLPLDPEPWVYPNGERLRRSQVVSAAGGHPIKGRFDPRIQIGYSGDESRYRGDPTSTESGTA